MFRLTLIAVVGVVWLAGCGDSVERRQLAEPAAGSHPDLPAGHTAADLPSPHGEMPAAASPGRQSRTRCISKGPGSRRRRVGFASRRGWSSFWPNSPCPTPKAMRPMPA